MYLHGHIIVGIVDKIIDVYTVNSIGAPHKRFKLLQLFSTITELLLKFGFSASCLCGLVFILNPIFTYVLLNQMKPMLPVYMPFIDENTLNGFIQLTLIQTIFIVAAVIGTSSADFMVVMIVLNIPIFPLIFSDNVHELNGILHAKNNSNDKPVLIKAKLRNLFFMFGEICE